jgi:hypothetical protein
MSVKDFPLRESGKETPQRILKAALDTWGDIEDLVIVANVDGEIYVAGTQAQETEVIGLLELGKYQMLTMDEE